MVLVKNPWTNYWLHELQAELLVSTYFSSLAITALNETCLYSLRVKKAYLDIESKLTNHRYVNILAFESAIQVLNESASNVRSPQSAVKITVLSSTIGSRFAAKRFEE